MTPVSAVPSKDIQAWTNAPALITLFTFQENNAVSRAKGLMRRAISLGLVVSTIALLLPRTVGGSCRAFLRHDQRL